MSDGIVDQFKYWGGADEESWDAYRTAYLMKPPAARVYDLQMADTWLAEQTSLTREHADLVVRKRQLFDLHNRLLSLGR